MEAKLKVAEFDCYTRSFYEKQRKEESRDAVVPDTMPDIAEVLCCWGGVLIRSKDLSAGRIRVEANIPAGVLCRGEDGRVRHLQVDVPVFLSAEGESIREGAVPTAALKLLNLEARTLNPRKVLVRAEIAAEFSAWEPGKFCCTEKAEGEEHIHAHCVTREISLVSAVGEKTFALTDDLSLPPAAEGVREVFCAGCDCAVDEVKSVGSKLIVKGRIKSRLVMLTGEGAFCHLEPVTDFSQIIELGQGAGEGAFDVWLIPSGTYCSVSPEQEGRINLEYHLVAQLVCHNRRQLCLMDDAYSNRCALELGFEEREAEKLSRSGPVRESMRQLFETARPVTEVIYCRCSAGEPVFDAGKMLLPLSVSVLCSGADGIWSEKKTAELVFRLPKGEGQPGLAALEIGEAAVLPVPGGMELRLEAKAEIWQRQSERLKFVSSLSYDEESPCGNSDKPSLVLLRLKPGTELWQLARENCSSVEAILSANGITEAAEAVGKLILIPKTD